MIVSHPECHSCVLSGFLLLFIILPPHYFPSYFSFLCGLCLGVILDQFSTEEWIFSFILQHRFSSFLLDMLFFLVPSVAAGNCSFCAFQLHFSVHFSFKPRIAASLKASPKTKDCEFEFRSFEFGLCCYTSFLANCWAGKSVPVMTGPEELTSLFLKWVLFFALIFCLVVEFFTHLYSVAEPPPPEKIKRSCGMRKKSPSGEGELFFPPKENKSR